jgi:hypothetical protein
MSGPSDIAIQVTGLMGTVAIAKKPSYLIIMDDSSKNKNVKKFITLDKPELLQGFVQVKGIFSDSTEDEIIKNFVDILTSTPKDLILEVLVPWHKISYMRSLVFKQK